MYYKYDLLAPKMSSYVLNSKTKNLMVNNWPTIQVKGVDVFDKLYIAHNEKFTEPKNTGTKQLMEVFGMDIDKLREQEWKGVDNAWIGLDHKDVDTNNISKATIYKEITRTVATEDRGNEQVVLFHYVTTGILPPMQTELDAIMVDVNAGRANYKIEHEYEEGEPITWHIAYADAEGLIYNRRTKVRPPLVNYNGNDTIYDTIIELRYSIKSLNSGGNKYTTPIAIDCDVVLQRVKDNDMWPRAYEESLFGYLPNVVDANGNKIPITDDTIYVTEKELRCSTDGALDPNDPANYSYKYWLRKDAIVGLKLKQFAKLVGSMLKMDYSKKKGPWWVKVVAVVLTVIIIVIAIIVAVFTFGAGGPLAVSGAVATIGAIATTVAITMTVITIVLGLYAGWAADQGYAADVAFIGEMIVIATDIGKIAGYVSLVTGGIDFYSNIGTMSTGQILVQTLSWINTGFTFWSAYDLGEDKKKLATIRAKRDKSEDDYEEYYGDADKVAEDLTSAKLIEATQSAFDNNISMDLLGNMDKNIYMAVEGNVVLSTQKYF